MVETFGEEENDSCNVYLKGNGIINTEINSKA